MSNDMDDGLDEDDAERENLDEDVNGADLEARHEHEEDDTEFEPEEDGEEEPLLAAADAEEEAGDEEAEATLDEILRQRMGGGEAEYEEEGQPEPGVAVEAEQDVRPRVAEEFVCRSCFLIKSSAQLADTARSLCRDCVANNARK